MSRAPRLVALTAGALTATLHSAIDVAHASVIDISGVVLPGDFDGDGDNEIAVSSPETNCGKGVVYVVSVTPPALTSWHRDTSGILGTAACSDLFGASLAVGDFNGDGRDDLAVSAPAAADAGPAGSGAIHVIYGSSTGLTATGDQLWHQDSSGIDGVAEVGDYFGDALEAGDFNCDGYDDLAIGVPRESLGTASEAGAAQVFYGGASGVSNLDDLWYQGSGGVDGAYEAGDHFGAALAHGNFNGDAVGTHACDDLAIAAPHEELGSALDSGFVYIIDGTSTGLETVGDQALHQDLSGVADSAETDDRFGWRLGAAELNGDAYDDLFVDVPGDACGSTPGVGRHLFLGSSGGVSSAGNTLSCDTFGCRVFEEGLGCFLSAGFVHGRAVADRLSMYAGDDAAWGGAGDDVLLGDFGNDRLFGGPGNDIFDGGPGRDVLIGGAGDDAFLVDAGCEIGVGDVIDGGPGTDVVRSHLTQSGLLSLGLTIASIETFVLIPADPVGSEACADAPIDDGPLRRPVVSLAWTTLPSPSSVASTTSGVVPIAISNTNTSAVVVSLEVSLEVRGESVPLLPSSITVPATSTATHNLDLHDFIPLGIDPGSVPPELLVLPTSAAIRVAGALTVAGEPFGFAFAPTIYGHIENSTTAVLYREKALHDTYHDGDLASWRAGGPAPSGPGRRLGVLEITGGYGIP